MISLWLYTLRGQAYKENKNALAVYIYIPQMNYVGIGA